MAAPTLPPAACARTRRRTPAPAAVLLLPKAAPRRRRVPRPLPPELQHLLSVLPNRERIEAVVDGLIDLLDALDGDPDREAEVDCCLARDDEPRGGPSPYPSYRDPHPGTPEDAELLLGWSAALNQEPHYLAAGHWHDDRESDGRCDDEASAQTPEDVTACLGVPVAALARRAGA